MYYDAVGVSMIMILRNPAQAVTLTNNVIGKYPENNQRFGIAIDDEENPDPKGLVDKVLCFGCCIF